MSDSLELVQTEELIKELQNRFECSMFCGYKPTLIKNSEENIHCAYWNGGISNAIGLLEYNKYRLITLIQGE